MILPPSTARLPQNICKALKGEYHWDQGHSSPISCHSPPWHGTHPTPAASRAFWHGQWVEHDPCTHLQTVGCAGLPCGKGLLCPFAPIEVACNNPSSSLAQQ